MIGAARYFAPRYWAERFFPKVGAEPDPAPPTGEISATATENLIGGSMTISVVGGSISGATPGGAMS